MILRSEVWSLHLFLALCLYSGPQWLPLDLGTEEGPLHPAMWGGQCMKKGLPLLRDLGTSICIAWSSGLCQLLDAQYQPVGLPWAVEAGQEELRRWISVRGIFFFFLLSPH